MSRRRIKTSGPAGDADAGPRRPNPPGHVSIKALIPTALAERMRNVVWHRQGPPWLLRMSSATEQALEAWVAAQEADHGGPFPSRTGELRGRRV